MAATNILDIFSDDFDYEQWAPIVKARLVEKGLWNVVENGTLPDPSKIPELAACVQPEIYTKWRDSVRNDTKALHILRSSLTKPTFIKTLSASSAKDVWDLLRKGNEEAKPRRFEKKFELPSMAEAKIDAGVAFDDLDYDKVWAPKVKDALVRSGLWNVVENGVPPDLSENPELTADARAKELLKWRDSVRKDSMAIQVMLSGIPDSDFRNFLSALSAKDLWELLKQGNEQVTLPSLEKKFEEISMEEGETLDLYVDRVMEIALQLTRMNNPKSEYEVIKKVLDSLSGSYANIAPLLEALFDLEKVPLHKFVKFLYRYESITEEACALMLKDLKLKLESDMWCGLCHENNHNHEECNTICRAGSSSGAREPRPRGGVCFLCFEGGHYARDCKRKNQVQVAAEAQKYQKDVGKVDFKMFAEEILGDFTYDEDMWLVYTTTSDSTINHMTPYEKSFTTLDRTHKAKVGSVGGKVVMVEGRGDVKIMMKEGKKKTIKNVLFVPGLKRNVLSLAQLRARGYSAITEAGKISFHDRTGAEFGETSFDERGLIVRLQVIEGNLTS